MLIGLGIAKLAQLELKFCSVLCNRLVDEHDHVFVR